MSLVVGRLERTELFRGELRSNLFEGDEEWGEEDMVVRGEGGRLEEGL